MPICYDHVIVLQAQATPVPDELVVEVLSIPLFNPQLQPVNFSHQHVASRGNIA